MVRKTPVKHIVKSYHRKDDTLVHPYWRGKGQLVLKHKAPPTYLGTPVEIVKDAFDVTYKIVNGTAYHVDTPDAVVRILENNLKGHRGERLHFAFGDPKTGRDWEETFDIDGYIGRSSGLVKIPLLIKNSRSTGGGGLLDGNIVKITETKAPHRVLYEHPLYHKGEK